jgi:excinuclease ABC subunit C
LKLKKSKRKLKFWRTTSPFYDCQPENYQYRCLSIVSDESAAYVNFLQISTVPSFDPTLWKSKKKLDETDEELLELAIIELRERFHYYRVIVPFHVDLGENIKITVPQLGDKKILDLSVRNAKFYRIEQLNNCKL